MDELQRISYISEGFSAEEEICGSVSYLLTFIPSSCQGAGHMTTV